MIINSIFSEKIKTQNNLKNTHPQVAKTTSLPQWKEISHIPRPYITPEPGPTFGGIAHEKMLKSVKGHPTIGAGIFTKDGKWVDFKKVGRDTLGDLDITKASDKEVYAYIHANALGESQHRWTSQYNKTNMSKMPATYPSISSPDAEDRFRENRVRLWDFSKNASLDVPAVDENGKIVLDCVVFDTETTGTNVDPLKAKGKKPLDRIVQVGAVQMKKGQVVMETAISQLINPEMPIPKESTNVHGITDLMVRKAPPMGRFLRWVTQDYLHKKNGVLVIYNAKFDENVLNNAIRRYNSAVAPNEQIKERQSHKILDPFILLQRIHPYMGVKKRLSDQYRYLFCRGMKGAHDALSDGTGTADVLNYCLHWLGDRRKDKTRPLMLREVLAFQNGEKKIKNLDFRMDSDGCNADVNFDVSERYLSMPVVNHPRDYFLGKRDVELLGEQIGEENLKKLIASRTKTITTKAGEQKRVFCPMEYKKRDNFLKVLGFAKMKPYNGKTVEDLHESIATACFRTTDQQAIHLWMKNSDPADISKGNDLPDINIARRVMNEAKGRKDITAPAEMIKLEDKPGANAPKGRRAYDSDDD